MQTLLEKLDAIGSDRTKGLEWVSAEIETWQDHNFPGWRDRKALMALGVCEEIGELGREMTLIERNVDRMADACGDAAVYCCALLRAHGYSLWSFVKHQRPMTYDGRVPILTRIVSAQGTIAHAQLKMDQNIRGSKDKHMIAMINGVIELVMVLDQFLCVHMPHATLERCIVEGVWPIDLVVRDVWAEVRKRDWAATKAAAAEGSIPEQPIMAQESK